MRIPFVGSAYEGRSKDISFQRCLNLYLEQGAQSGKTPFSLHGTPGLNRIASVGVGPNRGNGIVFLGCAYFISGGELIQLDDGYNATSIGSISTTVGGVSMAENGTQLMIVDGTAGYIYDGTTLSTISDPDYPGGTHVTHIDGYFVVAGNNGDAFNTSALRDGTAWDATDTASAERHPDDVKAIVADHRELWLLGESTTEIWYNSGNLDFPFSATTNGFIEWGIVAPHSLQKMDNGIVWLAQTERGRGYVVRTQGYTPKVISQPWLEYEFSTYITIADAQAYVYQQAGHEFYVLNFPSANKTWAYDARTKEWHERGTYLLGRHRSNGHIYFNQANIVGDYSNGNLYTLELDTYTDNEVTVQRIRTTPPIHQDRKWIYFHSLEIDFESGVGLTSGQGADPQAMLRWSDDGGHTWSNEHWRTIGKKGEYDSRAVWRRLGKARNRIFELTITDPVKVIIIDAHASIELSDY